MLNSAAAVRGLEQDPLIMLGQQYQPPILQAAMKPVLSRRGTGTAWRPGRWPGKDMTRHALWLLASLSAALLAPTSASHADPVRNADELGAALLACWTPPAGSDGSFVTLSFSLKRDGTLIGQPRPTEIDVNGDSQARQRFIDGAVKAIETCVPVEFSPEFAAGVGGQVFTLRFDASGN
jgi:hypothetical protein